MTKSGGDPWEVKFRRGYCYHAPIKGWKTDTLIRKWREGDGGPKRRAAYAYELSFRDPDLALAEVKAVAGDLEGPRRPKIISLCLHHVADVGLARQLFARPDFDPDALHLAVFEALLDDYLETLPTLDAAVATARLRKLGYLAGPVPNPIVDGPYASEAMATSPQRYDALQVRFLRAIFAAPALSSHRPEIAEHLRQTFAPDAYSFLLSRWAEGELSAVAAFAAIPRLGWQRALSKMGAERLDALVTAFVAELAGPAGPFETGALENGWLPGAVKEFPPGAALAVAQAYLDGPRFVSDHPRAAEVLVGLGKVGAGVVVDRASSLEPGIVADAARTLPYAEVRERLEREGVTLSHRALTAHPDAPPDLTLLARGLALVESNPGEACTLLGRAFADARHPDRETAFQHLLAFGRGSAGDRVRRFALHRLGELGAPGAIDVLKDALVDPALADARLLVETALVLVGGSTRPPPVNEPSAGPGNTPNEPDDFARLAETWDPLHGAEHEEWPRRVALEELCRPPGLPPELARLAFMVGSCFVELHLAIARAARKGSSVISGIQARGYETTTAIRWDHPATSFTMTVDLGPQRLLRGRLEGREPRSGFEVRKQTKNELYILVSSAPIDPVAVTFPAFLGAVARLHAERDCLAE